VAANLDQIEADIERGRAVLRATGSTLSFLDRSAGVVQDVISARSDISSAVQLWRFDGRPNPVLADPLDRRRAELAVWSAIAERTGPGGAQSADWPSVVQSIANVNPLGLAVTTAVTMFDDYLERRTHQQGYEKLRSALDRGFAGIRDTLGGGLYQLNRTIETGFQRLSAEFSWGLSELLWRADQQNAALAEIRDLLTRPLDVQSKELRARAIRSYDNGWMDEAVADFLDAMQKSRVDYVVAHYLGNIYLRREDYETAADWFRKSARWSRPEEPRHAAVALMHQALAMSLWGRGEEADYSRDAIACLDDALDLDPTNNEIRFQRAQLRARTGNADLAVADLEEVIDHDGRYLVRVLMESDFQGMGDQVADLVYWLTKSYAKIIERLLRQFTPFLRQFDEGIRVENLDTVINPYSGNDDAETFAEAVNLAASLYSAGDFHSVQQAQNLLLALQFPERKTGHERVWVAYPNAEFNPFAVGRYGSYHDFSYTFYGVGGDLV
jgi:tetratricopeptide (TPR) repeat protein